MTGPEVEKIFESAQALLNGHFLLSSGNHSNRYLQCALVTQNPVIAAQLADALVQKINFDDVSIVLGPAVGGIVIAQEVAQAIARAGNTQVRAIFCERVDGKMALRRGFAIQPGEKILAVEDVITTGGSVKEAMDLAKTLGGELVGVATFIDRSASTPDLGAPMTALLKVQAEMYTPENCPLCQQGIPANKPGSRGLK
jgi:orotate phosphoribosyltransferase